MDEKYKWYKIVSGENLQQGDLICNCPIVKPPKILHTPGEQVISKVQNYNVVVMSQSCDLSNGKIKEVLLCPYIKLSELVILAPSYGDKTKQEYLRQGRVNHLHLLNQCDLDKVKEEYLVIDFRNIYTLNIKLAKELVLKQKERVRLLPPYREHMAQAFARYFMRVGLPEDIPPFAKLEI